MLSLLVLASVLQLIYPEMNIHMPRIRAIRF